MTDPKPSEVSDSGASSSLSVSDWIDTSSVAGGDTEESSVDISDSDSQLLHCSL